MAGKKTAGAKAKKPNIFSLIIPYKGIILLLIFFTLIGNGVNLVIPKIISHGIDSYSNGHFILKITRYRVLFSCSLSFLFLLTSKVLFKPTPPRGWQEISVPVYPPRYHDRVMPLC